MNLKLNISTTGLQVLIGAVSTFFTYKILYLQVGPEIIGLWAVCMAVANLLRMADFGINSAIVKTSAENVAADQRYIDSRSCYNAMILVALFSIFFGILIQSILTIFNFNIEWLEGPRSKYLLALALISIAINNISSTAVAYLDGLQKAYLRNTIIITGNIVLVTSVYFFVEKNNVIDVALCFLMQSLGLLILSLLTIMRLNTVSYRISITEIKDYDK